MKIVTFTEFRKHASGFFSEVENGETFLILRHGRAIAKISPYLHDESQFPSWKKPRLKLSMKGTNLSKTILKEREVT